MANSAKPISSPVPIEWYPTLASLTLAVGLLVTAYFFIYEATVSKKNRSLVKELSTGAVASVFLAVLPLPWSSWRGFVPRRRRRCSSGNPSLLKVDAEICRRFNREVIRDRVGVRMDYGMGSWMMVPTESPRAQDLHAIHAHGQQLQFQDPQQQPQHQHQQHHQSLASDFHLLHIVESLAIAIEGGSRDQQLDALVNELTSRFNNCQQLLNSISATINASPVTVEGQKGRLEEAEERLNQRRDLVSKYKCCVEDLVGPNRQK